MTSAYQTRYSLAYLPPLLPYVVFAAVLHQFSLVIHPQDPSQEQRERVESPQTISPQAMYDPAYLGTGLALPFSHAASHVSGGPEAASPAHEEFQRKMSGISAGSTCFSHDNQARRPSSSSFVSGTTSDRDGPCSSGTGLNTLPTFTSRPADLVQIGLLQLTSMSSQHPGAAETVEMLRRTALERDLAEPSAVQNYTWDRPDLRPPVALNALSAAAAGVGLREVQMQDPSFHADPSATANADSTPRAVCVPAMQTTGPLPKASSFEGR